jgi:prevent-host-death family protein
MTTMTLTKARNQLLKLAAEIEQNPSTVVEVVKRGKPVLTLMSPGLYDSLTETLELLSDATACAKLREALAQIERGKGIPWKTAKERLDRGR